MRTQGDAVMANRVPSIRSLLRDPHGGGKFDKGMPGPAFGSTNVTEADSKAALASVEFWGGLAACERPEVALTTPTDRELASATVAANASNPVLLKLNSCATRFLIIHRLIL